VWTHDRNLQALIEAGTPVVTIFGKTWDLHVKVALGVSLKENLDLIRNSVAFLKSHGREVIYDAEHFFDGYKADPAMPWRRSRPRKRRALICWFCATPMAAR
jgi:2-isopropylmalate synthase